MAKLDLQADRQTTERHEYLAANWPGNPEVAVRVVLLPAKANDLDEVAKAIRTRTEVRNLYTYTPLRALAFRSIPSAAKAAEQLISERYQ